MPRGGSCTYCGHFVPALTKDHVVPRCRRHLLPPDRTVKRLNVVPCCAECNKAKGLKCVYAWSLQDPLYHPWSHRAYRILSVVVPPHKRRDLSDALATCQRPIVDRFLLQHCQWWVKEELKRAMSA